MYKISNESINIILFYHYYMQQPIHMKVAHVKISKVIERKTEIIFRMSIPKIYRTNIYIFYKN